MGEDRGRGGKSNRPGATRRARSLLGGLLSLILLTSAGSAQEEHRREEDLFGADDERPAQRLFETLQQQDDKLVLGGLLQLRLDGTGFRETDDEDSSLQSRNLLDLYLDIRHHQYLRAHARFRVSHDPTVTAGEKDRLGNEQERTAWLLDQLWIRLQPHQKIFLTVGKQPLKWGAGRFWNPTDFVNQRRRDPLDVFDERNGVYLVKVQIPVERLGWNFQFIGDFEDADTLEQVGGAFRAEFAFSQAELTASAAVRKDEPVRFGLDLSAGVGLVDFWVEAAVRRKDSRIYWEGDLDLSAGVWPRPVSRRDDWIPAATAGFEIGLRYTDQDSLYFGAEYFFNESGYREASLYPLLIADGSFEPFYLGEHYAGGYFFMPGPWRWDRHTFLASVLGNLADGSFLARFDHSVTVLTYLTVSWYGTVYFGQPGEFRLGFEVPPIPFIPELAEGLVVPSPRYGLGLRLAVTL
jgi:hypothetical protein